MTDEGLCCEAVEIFTRRYFADDPPPADFCCLTYRQDGESFEVLCSLSLLPSYLDAMGVPGVPVSVYGSPGEDLQTVLALVERMKAGATH
jgi:hypothetical protein